MSRFREGGNKGCGWVRHFLRHRRHLAWMNADGDFDDVSDDAAEGRAALTWDDDLVLPTTSLAVGFFLHHLFLCVDDELCGPLSHLLPLRLLAQLLDGLEDADVSCQQYVRGLALFLRHACYSQGRRKELGREHFASLAEVGDAVLQVNCAHPSRKEE